MAHRAVELATARSFVRDGRGRQIRVEAGLSLSEVATSVGDGVAPSTVLRWERGDSVPRADHAQAYWRLLVELDKVTVPAAAARTDA